MIKKVVTIILILALMLGASYGTGYAITRKVNPAEWFKGEDEKEPEKPEEEAEKGSFIFTPNAGAKMTFAATPYLNDLNSVYVTIITEPETTDDTFTWTSSAPEKVGVTPAVDGRSAAVTCTAAFGEQITIEATSNETGLKAVATCDYVKRLQSATLEIDNEGVIKFANTPTTYTATVVPEFGIGTITPEITVNELLLYPTRESIKAEEDYDEDGESWGYVGFDSKINGSPKSYQSNKFTVSDLASVARVSFAESISDVAKERYYQQLLVAATNNLKTYATGTDKDGTVEVKYAVTYNGVQYNGANERITVGVAFNVEGLKNYASNVTPDKPSIIF